MSDLKAPFPYFGGKSRIAPLVWGRFGDVPNYVETFFGSGAVLLARPHAARTETVNDADALLCNFWRAVQHDPEAVAAWADWPVSELDLHARHRWLVEQGLPAVEGLRADPDAYDAKVAGWWVWGISAWIGSGWCQQPDWKARPDLNEGDQGVHTTLPEKRGSCGRGGRGIHNNLPEKLPHVGNAGRGLHRKLPHLGDAGRGLHRTLSDQLPHVGSTGRGGHRAPARKLPRLSAAGQDVHRPVPPAGERAARRAWLLDLMGRLADRLRHVRVCCGDWARVMRPSVTTHNGLTAVFLDPPYSHSERYDALYSTESDVAAQVRAWAIANGDNPLLRIALCGYEGEHEMPDSWECVAWKARGGYGSQGEGQGRANAGRERVWFSPHCLRPAVRQLELLRLAAATQTEPGA